MKNELRDLFLILFNKKQYKDEIGKRYEGIIDGFNDLLGDGYNDASMLFYLINRKLLPWLDNDPEISIKEKDIQFREKFYKILKKIGPKMLGCTQVIENRKYINDPFCNDTDDEVILPSKPVIFVSNHGFRDDVLSSVLAANRHSYIYWGSIPQFYNTFDGLAASLVGEIIFNRKSKISKQASVEKVSKVMARGTDLMIFPEGGWNKTSELFATELWKGVYTFSKLGNYDIVPIVHYVRDMEIVNKKNIIHTIVDDPIHLYEMEQKEALEYLRDVLCSWQYKMAEVYGKSSRTEELVGFNSSDEKWHHCVQERMKGVSRYDSEIEKKSDYRPKEKIRPEEVYKAIANIQNINAGNAKMVLEAKKLVKERENNDFQRLY